MRFRAFNLGHAYRRFVGLAWSCALILIAGLPGGILAQGSKGSPVGPPATRTDNVTETLHGAKIVDPYRWLEDQDSPDTRAWLTAQNEYTQSLLGKLPGREALSRRLGQLLKIDLITTPFQRNGRYFFTKRLATQDLPVICMRKGLHGSDEVLVDPHQLSRDHTTSVSLIGVSVDGSLMMYSVREGGQDEAVVRFLDVDTRKAGDQLPKARYFGFGLKPDKSGVHYSRFGTEGSRVFYHTMGTDPSKDMELFGKGYGPDKIILCRLSVDGHYLVLQVEYGSAATKTEVYYQDLERKTDILPIVNEIEAQFDGDIGGDHLFLKTNWNAPNGRIFDVDLQHPGREAWREIVRESDATIEQVSAIGGRLWVSYFKDVASQVKVFEADGKQLGDVALPAVGSLTNIRGSWDQPDLFYAFSSFLIPTAIYRYDISSGAREEWARTQVPIQADRYEVKQIWYASKDGTKIPMFLVHAKGLKLDGSHPALLTGYGGFDVSLTPAFSSRAAIWVEAGGVFALANLRGGGEFGENWHRAGMLEKKQNVFDDFVAAAEWLIKSGYTTSSKLAISGGSNGGLLVGAALTQHPEMFRAVVCAVPLLDMVRYHKFLVARFWVPEYGSSEDAQQFKYIYAYSPYHHVKRGVKYPAVLFISGDSDTRVAPLHARKMAALLQASTGSDRPVLLHYDTKAGHSAGQPVNKQIDDLTDELIFLFWQLGVKQS